LYAIKKYTLGLFKRGGGLKMKRVLFLLLGCGLVGGLLLWGKGTLAAAPAASATEYHIYLPLVLKPVPPPLILQFEANVTHADPGDTITLTWQTADTLTTTLFHLLPTGQFGQVWEVEEAGTLTHTISISARNESRFVLTAVNSGTTMVQADVTIKLACPHAWFFVPAPDVCAQDAALLSTAAEQPFEQGIMFWVEESALIYVLFADEQQPQWQVFVDEWQEGDPIDDPGLDPPPGLYQPQRGFGLVWREQAQVRERLGWALSPETGYETAVQATSYPLYNHLYVLAADEQIWRLGPESSEWEKINPIGAAQAIADLINTTRANHGLPPYRIDMRLNQSARRHNLDMAYNRFTDHIGSDGSTPGQRMNEAGYNWQFAGEIIGWGFSGSHQTMFDWWMNSPIHRQMILSPTYEDFGLSYVFVPGSDWGHYWTVNMAKPPAANASQSGPLTDCVTDLEISGGGGGSSWHCQVSNSVKKGLTGH
jgi:uncharacterized protein YkwD